MNYAVVAGLFWRILTFLPMGGFFIFQLNDHENHMTIPCSVDYFFLDLILVKDISPSHDSQSYDFHCIVKKGNIQIQIYC